MTTSIDRFALDVLPDDHVRGAADATVTLVQYADFECLHCGRAFPILRELLDEFAGGVRLVFRHFPLGWEHPHALLAARAAEAAARQGKFWEMHDRLFANQGTLDRDALPLHAAAVGLDVGRWRADLESAGVAARVERDVAGGRELGVRGTPTFFLDGELHGDGWDLEALRAAIASALRRD